MKIIGIDPGLRRTGFGIITRSGQQLRYIASGVIKTPDADLPQRLGVIFDGIRALLSEHTPAHAAVERVFVNVNPNATLLLGQARGAAVCALVAGGVQVHEYTALQLKQAVVGYGRARKEQIQHMVGQLLQLHSLPGPDAADALGVAICHAHSGDALAALGNRAPAFTKKGLRMRRGRLIGPISNLRPIR